MGVFNTIKSSIKCPKCGNTVEWQSKRLVYDGFLVANAMQTLTLNEKMDGEMHTYCDKCKTGFDVTITKGKEEITKRRTPVLRPRREIIATSHDKKQMK